MHNPAKHAELGHVSTTKTECDAKRVGSSRRPTLTVIKVGATVMALVLVFRVVDPAAVAERARSADRLLLALALALMTLQIPLVSLRWALIVRALSSEGAVVPGAARFQQITWIAQFFGQVLPFVAGDGMRVLLLRDAGPSLRIAFKSTLLDRAVALLALFVIALPAALFSHVLGSAEVFQRSVILLVATGLIGAAAVLALVGPIHRFGGRWRVVGAITETVRDLKEVLLSPSHAAPVILLCCVVHGISILAFWVLARSQSLPFELTDALAIVPLTLVVSMVPIAVGGWGLRETFVVTLLGAAGIPADAALLLSLSFGTVVLLASLPGIALLALSARAGRPSATKAS